jgi:hypothetical protein
VYIEFGWLRGLQPDARHPGFLTNHAMGVNWRLQSSDLRGDPDAPLRVRATLPLRGDLAGRYLIHEKKRDTPVSLDDLARAPSILPLPGTFVYFAPLKDQHDLMSVLNAGTTVSVCSGTCVDGVVALALLCSDAASDNCSVALGLKPEQIATVAGSKDLRLVIGSKK